MGLILRKKWWGVRLDENQYYLKGGVEMPEPPGKECCQDEHN